MHLHSLYHRDRILFPGLCSSFFPCWSSCLYAQQEESYRNINFAKYIFSTESFVDRFFLLGLCHFCGQRAKKMKETKTFIVWYGTTTLKNGGLCRRTYNFSEVSSELLSARCRRGLWSRSWVTPHQQLQI